jgi:pimeloyl-ACP methyl ester carboxylesterase
VIVGHSFGGAVAIKAGELAPLASAVVGLSSQRYGTQTVEKLQKPLLLIHGADDDVLLPQASEDIFERAQEPKQLLILPGTGHALREVGDEVYRLLFDYISEQVGNEALFS